MAASAVDQRPPVDGDLVRSYLRDIGRVPLLSHEQEITLGRQVQELVRLEEAEAEFKMRQGHEPSREEMASSLGISPAVLRRRLINGRRAKERMVAANLRLVVSRQEVHQAEYGAPGSDPGGNHWSGARS